MVQLVHSCYPTSLAGKTQVMGVLTRALCGAGMALAIPAEDICDQCGRCEGWRYKTSLEDGICCACHREVYRLMEYDVMEDGAMSISVKMYYDHFRWHFQKELKDKVRGTRLIFAPFSAAALVTFRDYMMVQNPALYIPSPKQVSGMRGGKRIVWHMRVEDGVQFCSAMSRQLGETERLKVQSHLPSSPPALSPHGGLRLVGPASALALRHLICRVCCAWFGLEANAGKTTIGVWLRARLWRETIKKE